MELSDFFLNFFASLKSWLLLFRWGDLGWGDEFFRGTLLTLLLAILAFVAAIIIGVAGATLAQSNNKKIIRAIDVYSTISRCLPELIMVLMVYFVFLRIFQLPYLKELDFDSGIIGAPRAIAFISGAYSIEVFRGAYLAMPKGEVEAAHAYGFNLEQVRFMIIMPHLFRIALPGLGNIWMLLLKDVALVSLVGMHDLMGKANIATFSTKHLFAFYIMAAIIYLIITAVSEKIFEKIDRRNQRSSRPLVQN
ncbi:MAG: ABC transporter permease subunit [Alphaproteobacteria bacterium]